MCSQKQNFRSAVISLGYYVPERVLTNQDLEKIVDTTDEWILQRTGIRERHIVEKGQTTSEISSYAAMKAIQRADIDPSSIDLIVLATISHDRMCPSTACYIQHKIGAVNAAAFDIIAACPGFLHALSIADAFIRGGNFKRALVIGTEILSHYTDWEDRNTCVLFGDGSGAVILDAVEEKEEGIIATKLYADGSGTELLTAPGGGTFIPFHPDSYKNKELYLHMEGQKVFEFAVGALVNMSKDVIGRSPYSVDEIDWFVPHQANTRIIKSSSKRMNVNFSKFYMNIERYGNTSSASIPICLGEMYDKALLKKGQLVCMSSFGAGLTAAGALMRWII